MATSSPDRAALAASGRALTRRFVVRGETVAALATVDVDIPAATLVAVSGPSGSGKSTLLALLGCLDRPTSGSVEVAGRRVDTLSRRARRTLRRRSVATMLAQPADNLELHLSGRANIERAGRLRGGDRAQVTDAAHAVAAALGIDRFVDRRCASMSGGEQQRVALAGALVGSVGLVLADEPTGALDAASAGDVIAALRAAATAGTTIVVATHDPNLTAVADHVVLLDHGRRVG